MPSIHTPAKICIPPDSADTDIYTAIDRYPCRYPYSCSLVVIEYVIDIHAASTTNQCL